MTWSGTPITPEERAKLINALKTRETTEQFATNLDAARKCQAEMEASSSPTAQEMVKQALDEAAKAPPPPPAEYAAMLEHEAAHRAAMEERLKVLASANRVAALELENAQLRAKVAELTDAERKAYGLLEQIRAIVKEV